MEYLVQRIRAGDAAAEQRFVSTFRGGLTAMLQVRTSDPELAADLCHDPLLAVLERLRADGLDEPGKLKAFLRQTAINMHRNHLRKEGRRKTVADSDRVDIEPAKAGDPVAQCQRIEEQGSLRQLIEELSERDREIIWRSDVMEQAKREICDIMRLAPRQFDLVIFRARRRLRALALQRADR